MSFYDELSRVIVHDPRYSIEGYAFVLQALGQARHEKLKGRRQNGDRGDEAGPQRKPQTDASRSRKARRSGHVTAFELCKAVRELALQEFGLMAATVLNHWGVRTTSHIGDIVYNMIATGHLEKTPDDTRADFDNVFDFDVALRPQLPLADEDRT